MGVEAGAAGRGQSPWGSGRTFSNKDLNGQSPDDTWLLRGQRALGPAPASASFPTAGPRTPRTKGQWDARPRAWTRGNAQIPG